MFTKLLIAASTLLLVAYAMEPDNYDAQRRGPAQHASIYSGVSSTPAALYRA
jgi:hypothetical protein